LSFYSPADLLKRSTLTLGNNMKKLENILIAMGTAAAMVFGATSQASAQAAPGMPGLCWFGAKAPVCAERSKQRFTYNNARCATMDGAKVVSQGACPKAAAATATKGGKKSAKKAKKGGKKAEIKGKKSGKKAAVKAKKGGKKAAAKGKKGGKKAAKKSGKKAKKS
jgi:hypothetical protein